MRCTIQLIGLTALLLASGCATTQSDDPYAQTKRGAAIGAAIGAAAGFFVGDGELDEILGTAAVGAGLGAGVGLYMDKQEQELRDAMAQNDAVSIQRTQDVLTATFKSESFFAFDSSTLQPGASTEMDRVANILNKYPQTTIRVEGHTDSKGAEDYNQKLSEKRAMSVKNALVLSLIHI